MMYWEGDIEFEAFGCGATSYLDGYRFERPRSLKKYFDFVANGSILEGQRESEIEKLQTLILC